MTRPPVVFLAWSSVAGRSHEIAAALGGEARCFYGVGLARRQPALIRYLVNSLRTVAYLVARRPRALIVTNPPVFAALVAYPYARLARAPLLLDSHPDAFRSDGPHARFLGIHSWLARRARATLVTTDDLVSRVEAWGGVGLVVHEPPPDREAMPGARLSARPRVLVLGTLSSDEPVLELLEAARRSPEFEFKLTGDTRRCEAALIESAPANVEFLGFLNGRDYSAALQGADIAVVLTTWLRWAVPRSAYDAVYARRPLVVSDSEVLREVFPLAIPVRNDPPAIAAGIREAVVRHEELTRGSTQALHLQQMRWEAQLERLRMLISRNVDPRAPETPS